MFSKEEIFAQIEKIQYLYALKQEIRYGQTRSENTESVAEHIYGMHVCAQYFLPLENPEGTWDKARIYEMITLHDIDEIETGDVIGYLKSESMLASENDTALRVISRAPTVMHNQMLKIIEEYQQQVTPEARFVKALDKIDVQFQTYNENGKQVLLRCGTTNEQHRSIKDKYMVDFPYIQAFNNAISNAMQEEGFFTVVP